MDLEKVMQQGLNGVRASFLGALRSRLEAAEGAIEELRRTGALGEETLETLRFAAHKTRGAAATLGFPALGAVADTLEQKVSSGAVGPELTPALEDYVREARAALGSGGGA